mgnify:FL=1
MTRNKALFIGAIINFIISVGHLACLGCLQRMFLIYDIADEMNGFTESCGTNFPYIITVIIALGFFACGIYGLSACGKIRRLPLLKLGVFAIAAVFLFRALWGISIMIDSFTIIELSSTLVSAVVGLLYLYGGVRNNNMKK